MRILTNLKSFFSKSAGHPEPASNPRTAIEDTLRTSNFSTKLTPAGGHALAGILKRPGARPTPLDFAAAQQLAESHYRTVGFESIRAPQASGQGGIVYLAQCHNLGTRSSLMLAARSQPSILDALLQLKPRDVFVEGLEYDVDQTELAKQPLPDLRSMFKGHRAGSTLSLRHQEALAVYGAAAAYAACNPECTLRATTTPELQMHSDAAVAYQALPPGAINKLRESHLMQVLAQACAERPLEPKVVIWGASHDLRPLLTDRLRQPDFLWLNTSGLSMSDVREVQAFFAAENNK